MNKLTSWKRIGSLLLTLAMVITMSVTALPVYAAGTGSISVKYDPDIEGLNSTDFVLYKAGKYDRADDGKSIVVLEDQFAESKVIFPNGVGPDDPNWQKAWLGAANDLGAWAKNHESDLSSAWSGTLNATDSFQDLGEFENGIYLLVGKEKLVGEEFWTPVPVLIQVLNGKSEFTLDDVEIKMVSRPLVHKHILNKFWQDDGYSEGRPETVKIAIYHGAAKVDTVEFSNSKGYIYKWYSYFDKAADKWVYTSKDPEDQESEGVETEELNEGNSYQLRIDGEDATWGAEEIMSGHYAAGENMYVANIPTGESVAEDTEKFDITNTIVLPVDHDPPVKKVVNGDKPKKVETFEFSLTAISTTADIDEMPMPEGSDGIVREIKVKAGDEKEFGDIVFRIPGQYIYEIKEVDTGKEGYKYDPTVYRLVYDLTVEESEPGVYQLVMDLNTYKNGEKVDIAEYSFVNKYTGPPTPPAPPSKPDTGDTTNIILPAAVLAAAVLAFIILFLRRRKNGKDSEQ